MRFVSAIVAFVVAAVLIGLGIAQQTIFAAPDSLTARATVSGEPRFAVVDGKTLNSNPGLQTMRVEGSGTVFAAYARTEDVEAWLGDTPYARLSFSAETRELSSRLVEPEESATATPAPGETAAATDAPTAEATPDAAATEPAEPAAEQAAPNPAGSDLWLSERTGEGSLRMDTRLPDSVSVLLASDGTAPAPTEVSLTWPVENRTPWVGPLIVGGIVFAVLGLVLYVLGLNHLRKTRGPRRKGGDGELPRGRSGRAGRTASPVEAGAAKPRRSVGRSMTAAVPVILVPGLLLTGCSAESWPEFLGGAPAPTTAPSPQSTLEEAIENEDAPNPVVSERQLDVIMTRISETSTQADAAMDESLLRSRFSGPAMEQRLANYRIRAKKADEPVPVAIPADSTILALPQATDTWPRTVYTIVQNDAVEGAPTQALFLVQETPRDNYTVRYATNIVTSEPLPEVAPAGIGAARLEPDVKLLTMQPADVATAYADILAKGDASEFAEAFQKEGDTVRDQFGPAVQDKAKADLGPTGTIEFTKLAGGAEPIALATIDAGAIVAVNINEVEVTKPTDPRASLKVNGGATAALLGLAETTKGVQSVYDDQALFYVPPVNSGQKIVLLGFEQQLVSAKELP
ncbi:hypothetical protein ACFDTO_14255 [Microbacteriaceae bacterium 4G12]